jgi:hypothetical protein
MVEADNRHNRHKVVLLLFCHFLSFLIVARVCVCVCFLLRQRTHGGVINVRTLWLDVSLPSLKWAYGKPVK